MVIEARNTKSGADFKCETAEHGADKLNPNIQIHITQSSALFLLIFVTDLTVTPVDMKTVGSTVLLQTIPDYKFRSVCT